MNAAALRSNGLALLALAAVVDSSSAYFSRLAAIDGFTMASGRGLFAFLFILALLVLRDGRGTWRALVGIGVWGLVFAALNSAGMIMNILSLKLTAVANFFMIFATAPFAAAIAGRLVLGEKLDVTTLLAAIAGMVGIAVMMFSGARSGGLLGDILALCVVMTYSAIVLLARYHKFDVLPAICVTTLFSFIFALPMADFTAMPARDIGVLAIFGIFQLGLGNILIFRAVSRIPAAQSGLLGILSAAFAPIWVFVLLGEVPPPATLAGGAIILTAAATHLAWTIYSARRTPAEPVPFAI